MSTESYSEEGFGEEELEGSWEGGAHGAELLGLLLSYPDNLEMWVDSSLIEGI